jgi:hypothetical protein
MKSIKLLLVFLGIILLIFAGWRLERWINWKFAYGVKTEERIEQLEKRIELIESRLGQQK